MRLDDWIALFFIVSLVSGAATALWILWDLIGALFKDEL